jgi:hypothetical protein
MEVVRLGGTDVGVGTGWDGRWAWDMRIVMYIDVRYRNTSYYDC